jgi:hypothetical protein
MNIWLAIAQRLPKQLQYATAINVIANVTVKIDPTIVVPDLTAMDALKMYADYHRLELL